MTVDELLETIDRRINYIEIVKSSLENPSVGCYTDVVRKDLIQQKEYQIQHLESVKEQIKEFVNAK